MRTVFLLCAFFIGLTVAAQERCASAGYVASVKAANPSEAEQLVAAETFLQKKGTLTPTAQARLGAEEVIRIPVVVHVLFNSPSQNISEAQIRSQIDALNRDFRRKNSDTVNTPQRFRSVAADVKIEFYLATSDPKGRATTGIVRKATSVSYWLYNDKIKFSSQGGDDAWDSKSYLNIWVGSLASGAGYSSAPGGDAAKDGVVIATSAFGTFNVSGNYTNGRTAAHEVGHWMGLKHIWGDAQCGDDGISDTPPQSGYTQNCPTGFRSTCTNGEDGDMYMNYMDYTADACTNLFTLGQKKRMRANFETGGPRETLLQSNGLKMPSADASPLPETVSATVLYPNPTRGEISLNLGENNVGKIVTVFNANGRAVQSVQVTSPVQKLALSHLSAGLYFVKGEGLNEKFVKL